MAKRARHCYNSNELTWEDKNPIYYLYYPYDTIDKLKKIQQDNISSNSNHDIQKETVRKKKSEIE